LNFIIKASRHYLAPLTLFVKINLDFYANNYSNASIIKTENNSTGKFTINKKDILILKKTLKKIEDKRKVMLIKLDRLKIYLYLISKSLKKGGQILILLPTSNLIFPYYGYLSKIFNPNNIAILDKSQNKTQFNINILKCLNQDKLIIIATRTAILFNYKNLKTIIIDECQDDSFKEWNKKPFYDARTLAEFINQENDVDLILGSGAPRINQFYNYAKKNLIVKAL
jgi:primosomal protein N'